MRTMAILKFVPIELLIAVAIAGSICGCGSGASTLPSGATPTITSFSPTSTAAGGASFTLTVLGSNFVSSSVVQWNGSNRPTTFVSSSQLTAQISASDIAATGTAAITVFDTAPRGGTSNVVNFTIEIPVPAITNLFPPSTAPGGPGFTLTVFGSNFVSSSVVRWNGSDRLTAFFSSSELSTQISASDIAATGTVAVTVFNPAPGGGSSNGMNFSIQTNPVPTINSLFPSGAPVGKQAFALGVSGSNFVSSSVVRWNGSDRPTTLRYNGGQALLLTAPIPASDIAATGTAAVTVFNPAPGGGSSDTLTFTIAAGGIYPQSVTVDPTGRFAYVANEGDFAFFAGNVSMYAVNPTTGALTFIGSQATADFGPHSVAVDPSGKFAYVANVGDPDICATPCGNVSMYTITTTGALTFIGTAKALDTPWSVAVDPSGKFAYVANEGGFGPTSISMYTINATTGDLTSIGMVAAGGRALSVAVHPSGKFAYVADGSPDDNVSMYTISATSGALTSIGTIAAGASPTAIAIDPSGKFAYVTNSNSNDVSMYTINSDKGMLTSMGPITAGTAPSSVAVDPTGKFAYVTNSGSNDVSMYTINTTTGVLTSGGTIPAGSSPSSIAIDPSGKFAYVTNSGSHNVSRYRIDAVTGALTLIGTISS